MNISEYIFLNLTIAGLIATILTTRETYLDYKIATPELRDGAKNFFRHEIFRLIKQFLLTLAVGSVALKDILGVDRIIFMRSGILVIISLFISLNSLLDLGYRKNRRRQIWESEIEKIKQEARQRLNDITA